MSRSPDPSHPRTGAPRASAPRPAALLVAMLAGLSSCAQILGFESLSPEVDAGLDQEASDSCIASATDPLNCGACNHSCAGGECRGGKCQPAYPVLGVDDIQGLAVTKDYLYFTGYASGLVGRARKQLGGVETLAKRADAWALAVDDTDVYFGTNPSAWVGDILRCPTAGCGGNEPYKLVSDQRVISSIALDNTYFYWTAQTDHAVRRAPKTNGSDVQEIFVGKDERPMALLLAGDQLFFVDEKPGTILRVPAAGGDAVLYALGEDSATGIALQQDRLYWTAWGSGGAVRWMQKDQPAGEVKTIASGGCINASGRVAADDRYVYWTQCSALAETAMSLVVCEREGCTAPRVLLSDLGQTTQLLLDEEAVYVAVRGTGQKDGAVVKIAKPAPY